MTNLRATPTDDEALAVRGDPTYASRRSYSIEDAAAQLTRAGLSWSPAPGQPVTVTYGFRATAPGSSYGDIPAFSRFTDVQIAATELMLAAWSDVAGITFARAGAGGHTDSADMLFGNFSDLTSPASAFAYLPGSNRGGDVWVNAALSYNQSPQLFGYGYFTLVHEIGHAIGLLHPGDYNAGAGKEIVYHRDAAYVEDSNQYTVMSYFSEYNTGAGYSGLYASAPLLDDIAAAQRLYGANMSTRMGDTVYGFNANAGRAWFDAGSASDPRAVVFAVWDAGGIDTLDFSGYSFNGRIDLRQGAFSSVGGQAGNVSIAIGADIENAVGGNGADVLTGNGLDNRLAGGLGDDSLQGGAGSDTAVFSGQRAAYDITAGTETIDGIAYAIVTVSGPEGRDVLRNVERLQFADVTIDAPQPLAGFRLEGDLLDNAMAGTGFADRLSGEDGDDSLFGAGGDDRLSGGRGDDVLDGGDGLDEADYSDVLGPVSADLTDGTASDGWGADTLLSIENLRGGAFDDHLAGDGRNNVIRGGGGADLLQGRAGDDVLMAGAARLIGVADIIKTNAYNTSRASAISLEGAFDRVDAYGELTVDPVAVVRASASGAGREYYSFVVTEAMVRYGASFEILSADFDSVLTIYDATGAVIRVNDDWLDRDARVGHTFQVAGTYYVEVSQWVAGEHDQPGFTTRAPDAGSNYVLQVTAREHEAAATEYRGATLEGGAGDDILYEGDGSDILDGGEGHDIAVIDLSIEVAFMDWTPEGDLVVRYGADVNTLRDIEVLRFRDYDLQAPTSGLAGTSAADTLTGGDQGEMISGLEGNDRLYGMGGSDVLFGGYGGDILDGGAGADILIGGAGSDIYVVDDAGDVVIENDPVYGGTDTVWAYTDYVLGDNVEYLRLQGTAVRGFGNSLNNYIYGNDTGNVLGTGGGRDWIWAGGGEDTIVLPGSRDDYLVEVHADGSVEIGGAERTVIFDGEWLQFEDALEAIGGPRFDGSGGDDFMRRHNDDDVMRGRGGDDEIYGGGGDDTLYGGSGKDRIYGQGGDDVMVGGVGGDLLDGGGGFDTVDYRDSDTGVVIDLARGRGRGGDAQGDTLTSIEQVIGTRYVDVFIGGQAAEVFRGGGGADVFIVGGKAEDRILDFQTGVDRLQVRPQSLDEVRLVAVSGGFRVEWKGGSVLVNGTITLDDIDPSPILPPVVEPDPAPLTLPPAEVKATDFDPLGLVSGDVGASQRSDWLV